MLITVIFKKLILLYNHGSQKNYKFQKPTFFTTQFFPENYLFLLCFWNDRNPRFSDSDFFFKNQNRWFLDYEILIEPEPLVI
jgi:hypothetical protein